MARTIESVLNQTSCDFEYIICDGKSTDKTVEIAESYRARFAEKGVDYIINSEKDKGIYDGMNTGIDLATGDYVYFLNAGDWFYSDDVVEKVVGYSVENSVPDVVFGNVANVERNVVGILKGRDDLYNGMTMCHQAVFASTTLMKERKYNLKYRIMADYDFLFGLKIDGKSFSYIDKTIAYFSVGGVSSIKPRAFVSDYLDIHKTKNKELGFFSKMRVYAATYKTTVAHKIKKAMPEKTWYWWSLKVKKKTKLNSETPESEN
jgi:glycosyltransferase involved in cell wall biosynthesis